MFQGFYVPHWMTVPTARISMQVAASPLAMTLVTRTVGRATVTNNSVSIIQHVFSRQPLSSRAPMCSDNFVPGIQGTR